MKTPRWLSNSTSIYLWKMRTSVQFSLSIQFSSVQFRVSDSLRPHEPQHGRPSCPSPTRGVHLNPFPLSRWCHPTMSCSVVPFCACPQSFLPRSFPMNWPHQVAKVLELQLQGISVLLWRKTHAHTHTHTHTHLVMSAYFFLLLYCSRNGNNYHEL